MFSGCEMTSSLSGKDKKSFFHTWMRLLHYLKKLSSVATPGEINDDEFEMLEFSVVRLYSKTYNT